MKQKAFEAADVFPTFLLSFRFTEPRNLIPLRALSLLTTKRGQMFLLSFSKAPLENKNMNNKKVSKMCNVTSLDNISDERWCNVTTEELMKLEKIYMPR